MDMVDKVMHFYYYKWKSWNTCVVSDINCVRVNVMKGKETHAIYLIYYPDLRKGDENEEFMTIRRLIHISLDV